METFPSERERCQPEKTFSKKSVGFVNFQQSCTKSVQRIGETYCIADIPAHVSEMFSNEGGGDVGEWAVVWVGMSMSRCWCG